MSKCNCTTKTGKRCARKPKKGSNYCWQHSFPKGKCDKPVKVSPKSVKKESLKKPSTPKSVKKESLKKPSPKKEDPTLVNARQQIHDLVKDWKTSNQNGYKIEFDELESDKHYIEYDEALVYVVNENQFEIIYNDERFTQKEDLTFAKFTELYANILQYHPDTSFTLLEEED
jgi:hypothetical protein